MTFYEEILKRGKCGDAGDTVDGEENWRKTICTQSSSIFREARGEFLCLVTSLAPICEYRCIFCAAAEEKDNSRNGQQRVINLANYDVLVEMCNDVVIILVLYDVFDIQELVRGQAFVRWKKFEFMYEIFYCKNV